MKDEGVLTAHLRSLLGEEGLVLFCQALGGTRVYVPYGMKDDHEIVRAIGRARADALSRAMARFTIRVPLARRDRALWYRAQGLSDAAIARALGITETGVSKLFGREPDLPARPAKSRNPAQLTLL